MAGDTQITMIGNLVADPELRFTPSGAAVASFRVASTPRFFDKQSNEILFEASQIESISDLDKLRLQTVEYSLLNQGGEHPSFSM